MLIRFQWSHRNADRGNYMFIPLVGKEAQLLLRTGSRTAHVKNTIQLPELKIIYMRSSFTATLQLLYYPSCFIKKKNYITPKYFILNTGTLFHL